MRILNKLLSAIVLICTPSIAYSLSLTGGYISVDSPERINPAQLYCGYYNMGTDEEPEQVFGIFVNDSETDEVLEQLWLNETTEWAIDPFNPNQYFFLNSDFSGVNIEMDPKSKISFSFCGPNVQLSGRFFILYDELSAAEVYDSIFTAANDIGMKEVTISEEEIISLLLDNN